MIKSVKRHTFGIPAWALFAAISVFTLTVLAYDYMFQSGKWHISSFALGWIGGGTAEMAAQFYRGRAIKI